MEAPPLPPPQVEGSVVAQLGIVKGIPSRKPPRFGLIFPSVQEGKMTWKTAERRRNRKPREERSGCLRRPQSPPRAPCRIGEDYRLKGVSVGSAQHLARSCRDGSTTGKMPIQTRDGGVDRSGYVGTAGIGVQIPITPTNVIGVDPCSVVHYKRVGNSACDHNEAEGVLKRPYFPNIPAREWPGDRRLSQRSSYYAWGGLTGKHCVYAPGRPGVPPHEGPDSGCGDNRNGNSETAVVEELLRDPPCWRCRRRFGGS
ncbi:hypothetical protein AAG570_006008 [Ranatra chinensis]|uniref:Uncharacterized protein n=1 Tax=Ranatra chinensis TaxID=642074 RepID=A0ABD0XX35_9HEMI